MSHLGRPLQIIVEARWLQLYPVGKTGDGFTGGTEYYLRRLARGLAERAHTVHVVTSDLEAGEQRGPTEFWWGPHAFPTSADVVVAFPQLDLIAPYAADLLILASNGVDPDLGENDELISAVDAVACFSQAHAEILTRKRPGVPREKCCITGLGVELADYQADVAKVPDRLLWSNDPARGFWHLLDIYDRVKQQVPELTLHVAYDFERQFALRKWNSSIQSEMLWECRERVQATPGIMSLGALTRPAIIAEQQASYLHVMPSDPPNLGSQIHGMLQLELAAAGTPLVLSDTEAFPEVFGSVATILPLPGKFVPEAERRVDAGDWAEVVVDVLRDRGRWERMSMAGRALAEQHTWPAMIDRWEAMLAQLMAGKQVAR